MSDINGIYLMMFFIFGSLYLIRGSICFCEFIKEPVESGELAVRLKRNFWHTALWLIVILALIVAVWPIYVRWKGKYGYDD